MEIICPYVKSLSICHFTMSKQAQIDVLIFNSETYICRVSVNKALDLLVAYRPNKQQFPIIVSQDCGHQVTIENWTGFFSGSRVGTYKLYCICKCIRVFLGRESRFSR